MRDISIVVLGIAVSAVVVVGCGTTPEASVAPSITIRSPAGGATATLGTDASLSFPITFTTGNFQLKAAGSQGCGVGCGHVQLLIDGNACNDIPSLYNNIGVSSPLDAHFASCVTPTGDHVVMLELHNDDDSPLKESNGTTVSSSVAVKTSAGNSGAPSVGITSPGSGASVALGVDVNKSVPLVFTTQNFTLASAGTPGCGSGCGHVNVLIDGAACNAAGMPYNATGSASPISALFGLCAVSTGSHVVTVELQNDDNTAVAGVNPASVTFTTH